MSLWERDRPFSWWRLRWTDTGERPPWWCLLLAIVFFVAGLTSHYDSEGIGWTACTLILAGYNLGQFGMKEKEK